jgi:multidrug resistance protein
MVAPTKTADTATENIVDWDGPLDQKNPLNWASGKKTRNVITVGMIALFVNLASTMFAPAAPLLVEDLGITSSMVGSLTVSIFLLGNAIGPLILSPLSELYGRLIIYQSTNLIYLAFTLGCAMSKNTAVFLLCRFICGCAGSATTTLAGATVADLFVQEKRGAMFGMVAMGPILGPIVGPIAGGYIGQELGWRWTFWVLLIGSGIINLLALGVLRETYAPVLLARKTTHLQKAWNNPALRSKLDRGFPASRLISISIQRPLKLLIFHPMVSLMSLYVAFTFGLTFLLFTTFPAVFSEQYGFSVETSGLAYLGMGIGFMIGIILFSALSDRLIKAKTKQADPVKGGEVIVDQIELGGANASSEAKAGPKFKPELRLLLMVWLTPLLPFGFFWYGWAAQERAHWIVTILGTGLIGISSLFIMMPAQSYLIDIFGSETAASALAALSLSRSLFGAFLPLAGPPLYEALGLGWGNTLLGCIGLAFVPVPLLFYKYGERVRAMFPVEF